MSSILQEAFQQSLDKDIPENQPFVQNLETPFQLVGSDGDRALLADTINRVAESKLGKEILETAAAAGYELAIDDLGANTSGVCRSGPRMVDGKEVKVKQIVLSSRTNPDKWVSTLAHEARHGGQISNGAFSGYSTVTSLKSQLVEKRLMEADAVACSIIVCEELLQQGDYAPLMVAKQQYRPMVEAYEEKIQAGKSQPEAITACALTWYDDAQRLIGYEEGHVITPLAQALYGLNPTGQFKENSVEDSIKKICTFEGDSYFTESPEVLKTPKRAGISSATQDYVSMHVDECKKRGADVSNVVEGLSVYEGRPFAPRNYPALSAKGEQNLAFGLKRGVVKNIGQQSSQQAVVIKAALLKQKNGR